MIIAFDGNVYSGKTTLIESLARKINANIVGEYSQYFNENNQKRITKKDYFAIQKRYLLIDQKRNLSLSSDKINLLDRSFISLFAHVLTIYKRGIDIRKETLKEFSLLLKANKIIIPTVFINVEYPYALAKERFIDDQKYLLNRNTAEYLIEKDYFYSIQQFNKLILGALPSLRIDATKNTDENLKKIIYFLNNCPIKLITNKELIEKIRVVLLDEKNSLVV